MEFDVAEMPYLLCDDAEAVIQVQAGTLARVSGRSYRESHPLPCMFQVCECARLNRFLCATTHRTHIVSERD